MSAGLRAGYKLTEVGVIPEDWEASNIGSNSGWMSGGTPSRSNIEYWSGTVPWISGSTLKSVEISTSDQFLTAQAVAAGSKMAPVDSTLLLVRGSALHSEIRAGLVVAPVAFNQDVKALVPSATVEAKFLTYYILAYSNQLLKLVSSAGNSAGVLDTELVQNFKFLKPPLPEQRAIAEALSDADALIESLNQLITKKRNLKQAAMQQLLTGQTRLPGFSGEWEKFQVGEFADVKTGPFGSSLHESDYVQDGTPIITVEHLGEFGVTRQNLPLVSEEDCKRLRSYALETGDIVFSRVGSVDRNALIREDEEGWLFSGRLLRVRPDKKRVFAPYLSFRFHSEEFKNSVITVAVGQTMASLNTKILRDLTVAVPSFEEQTAIATILSDMDTELAELESRLAKARHIKQGMMQELLTGRIRLLEF